MAPIPSRYGGPPNYEEEEGKKKFPKKIYRYEANICIK